MGHLRFSQRLIEGVGWAGLGIAVTLPFFLWGSDKAPEFYGSLVAAIVAAVAVVLATSYQAQLTRQRDEAVLQQERKAEAASLLFWLNHAADEMDFLTEVVLRMKKQLGDDDKLNMPLEQLRQVLSAGFFREITERVKSAAKLPSPVSEEVANTLYTTYRAADRIFELRGAVDTFKPSQEQLDNYLVVTARRTQKLREAAELVRTLL